LKFTILLLSLLVGISELVDFISELVDFIPKSLIFFLQVLGSVCLHADVVQLALSLQGFLMLVVLQWLLLYLVLNPLHPFLN
jgi:hypothetical protein